MAAASRVGVVSGDIGTLPEASGGVIIARNPLEARIVATQREIFNVSREIQVLETKNNTDQAATTSLLARQWKAEAELVKIRTAIDRANGELEKAHLALQKAEESRVDPFDPLIFSLLTTGIGLCACLFNKTVFRV